MRPTGFRKTVAGCTAWKLAMVREKASGLNTAAGLGGTALLIKVITSTGKYGVPVTVGVLLTAGVKVMVGVRLMVGVSEMVGVKVIVGVRVKVGLGGKYR